VAGGSKRKTTMAKLNRERGLVERRLAKQARKAARKAAAAAGEHETAPPPADGGDDTPETADGPAER